MKELVTRESITTICNECDIQPNHLFACFRKTLGVSQAKLAYILDTEGIKTRIQNTQQYIMLKRKSIIQIYQSLLMFT